MQSGLRTSTISGPPGRSGTVSSAALAMTDRPAHMPNGLPESTCPRCHPPWTRSGGSAPQRFGHPGRVSQKRLKSPPVAVFSYVQSVIVSHYRSRHFENTAISAALDLRLPARIKDPGAYRTRLGVSFAFGSTLCGSFRILSDSHRFRLFVATTDVACS